MNKIETTSYTIPPDQKEDTAKRPVYTCGDTHKENFTHNGVERKKQANIQAVSKINQMLENASVDDRRPLNTVSVVPTTNNLPDEPGEEVYINPMPKVPDGAFPPSLESAVNAACLGTEAHPMAVAIHYVAYFASHVGQCRYIRIGNEKHSLDFFGILVGQSGKVKGTAEAQARHIEQLAITKLQERYGYIPPRRLSGLSSGEGLIQAIKDPEDEGDEKGITDKRLLVTESEYANVLTQDQRKGNTLSMVLRDAYDGKQLSNITLSPRTASDPHISIIGHITRGEFIGHKSFAAQAANGALNRNLIFFAKRGKKAAVPRAYTEEEAEDLSQWLADSIIRARDEKTTDDFLSTQAGQEMAMSEDALAVIKEEYDYREDAQDAMPEVLANMVSRQRTFVWRLSAIFALMDNTDTVRSEHVRQAYHWLDYSMASIRFLLNTERQESEQKDVLCLADEIYDFLLTFNNGKGASSTDISRKLFSGNKKAKEIQPALKSLIESSPPKIEQYQPDRKGRGKKATIFRPINTK